MSIVGWQGAVVGCEKKEERKFRSQDAKSSICPEANYAKTRRNRRLKALAVCIAKDGVEISDGDENGTAMRNPSWPQVVDQIGDGKRLLCYYLTFVNSCWPINPPIRLYQTRPTGARAHARIACAFPTTPRALVGAASRSRKEAEVRKHSWPRPPRGSVHNVS